MKEKTKQLLAQVDKRHDWTGYQPRSNGGTDLHWTEECQVCGLRRHYCQDPQNGNDGKYRFSQGEEDLTLAAAAGIECC